jgi:CopG family nickel-responsive transcriptional regulator
MKSSVRRVSVSVEPGLVDEFDATTGEMGLNRSTAIETAMRDFLAGYKWSAAEEGAVAGAVTMIYDHHVRGLGESLTHVQHDYLDVVSSATHVHLDHDNCLEILAVKGDIGRIKELTQGLRVIRGVKQLKFSILNIH